MPYLKITMTFLFALICATQSHAGTWMEDYFQAAGGAANASAPDVYQSQTQTVISGGGFSGRLPVRATPLVSFSPPGYKMGCGGIDAWLGAYGFVNKAEFIAALRNLGQNAAGYFFQLALKTMAPEIDSTLTEISNKINQLNQFQVGGCNQAKMFFKDPVDTKAMDMTERAKVLGSSMTLSNFSDWFNANESTKASATDTNKTHQDYCALAPNKCKLPSGEQVMSKLNSNIAWDALKHLSNTDMSTTDKELMMGLFGTVIFHASTDNDKGPTIRLVPSSVRWSDLINGGGNTGKIKLHSCPETVDCLFSADVEPPEMAFKGFKAIAQDGMVAIKDAIINRYALTTTNTTAQPHALDGQRVVAMSSIPIYQMISYSLDAGRGSPVLADQLINLYSEIVAYDMAYSFVTQYTRELNYALRKYSGVVADPTSKTHITYLQEYISKETTNIHNEYTQVLASKESGIQSMGMIIEFQKKMFTSLGPSLTANVMFGQKK